MLRWLRAAAWGLSFGLAAATASAGEIEWRAVSRGGTADTTPVVTLEAPVRRSARPEPAGTAHAVLGAPVRPVSFRVGEQERRDPVVRAQNDELPRPMPLAPEPSTGKPAPTFKAPPPTPVPQPALPLFGPGQGCLPGPDCGNTCQPFADDDDCASRSLWWVSADYLMWWMKGNNLPALVTTGSPADDFPGALWQPRTFTLFGGEYVDTDTRSGGRFQFGRWLGEGRCLGLDGAFFFLGQRAVNFTAGSGGDPALFRPFLNPGVAVVDVNGTPQAIAIPPTHDAQPVAFPGIIAGAVNVNLSSRLWGAEANLRTRLCDCPCWYLDLIGGFRFLGLDENLDITETLTRIDLDPPVGILVNDRFETRNRFYAAQVGLEGEWRRGPWFVNLKGKLALGNVHQTVYIQGDTTVNDPLAGGLQTSPGGLLTAPTNIGRYDRNRFAVLPEVGINLGYHLTEGLRIFLGYNVLYLSNVVRPENTIDFVVNPTFLPAAGVPPTGPARPAFAFKDTDFWAQGVNFGLELRW
jgi:hypothetical protein